MQIITSCLALGTLAFLAQGAPAQLLDKKALTLEAARKMVAGAEAEAGRNHLAGVVAVVDDGGWPILIERMDHAAYLASVELAPGKARTAALFKEPSSGARGLHQSRAHRRRDGAWLHRDARRPSGRGGRPGDRRHRRKFRHA